jgi:hypothetical protein
MGNLCGPANQPDHSGGRIDNMTEEDVASLMVGMKNGAKQKNQITLEIECKKLPKQGIDIDPFCVIYKKEKRKSKALEYLDSTETIENSQDPKFVKSVPVSYEFGANQWLEVHCYHAEDQNNRDDLSK